MNAFNEPLGAPRAPVHHYHLRLLKRDRALIYKASNLYNRAYNREANDYLNRNHWSRKNRAVPADNWEDRYPVEYLNVYCSHNCTVWRSNAGTTVILRDGDGYLVASYEVSEYGRLTRIH